MHYQLGKASCPSKWGTAGIELPAEKGGGGCPATVLASKSGLGKKTPQRRIRVELKLLPLPILLFIFCFLSLFFPLTKSFGRVGGGHPLVVNSQNCVSTIPP